VQEALVNVIFEERIAPSRGAGTTSTIAVGGTGPAAAFDEIMSLLLVPLAMPSDAMAT
jgi:hypothetical protein